MKMTRSTVLITAAKVFGVIGSIAYLSACKGPARIEERYYFEEGYYDTIPYTVYKPAKAESAAKLIIHLPSHLDSTKLTDVAGWTNLTKWGYTVISIHKAKTADYYLRKGMDFREQRLRDVLAVYKKEAPDTVTELSLLGNGEGAYLCPPLADYLKVDQVIAINGGPFSELQELQVLSERDSFAPVSKGFLEYNFGLNDPRSLQTALTRVKDQSPEHFILGENQNLYWLSYDGANLPFEYQKAPGNFHWVFFEDYPLFFQRHLNYLKVLSQTRESGMSKYYLLEGKGLLAEPRTQEELFALLKIILKP